LAIAVSFINVGGHTETDRQTDSQTVVYIYTAALQRPLSSSGAFVVYDDANF